MPQAIKRRPVRRTAARAGMPVARLVPVLIGGKVAALLELYRSGLPFGPEEEALAAAAAAHLARRSGSAPEPATATGAVPSPQETWLVGAALAAGGDEQEAAEQIVRVAEATGAVGATLWRLDADGAPSLVSTHGFGAAAPDLVEAAESVRRSWSCRSRSPVRAGSWLLYTIPLGQPPRLLSASRSTGPPTRSRPSASPFGVGAALALQAQPARCGRRGRAQALADPGRRRQPGDRASSRSSIRSIRQSSERPSSRRAGWSRSTSGRRGLVWLPRAA